MDPSAMKPFGLALLDFHKGNKSAFYTIIRDDGSEEEVAATDYFREPHGFTVLERTALDQCRGDVLDVGAGSGRHSLTLQRRGLRVSAIDISPEAVQVMRETGVADAREADVFQFGGGHFDTILMLGHGIGMAGDIEGLRKLLPHLRTLLRPKGQVLTDSVDPRASSDPRHLAYHEVNRRAGRYLGETRLSLRFKSQRGSAFGWLLVDPDTLANEAMAAGWTMETVQREADGNYLARLICQGS